MLNGFKSKIKLLISFPLYLTNNSVISFQNLKESRALYINRHSNWCRLNNFLIKKNTQRNNKQCFLCIMYNTFEVRFIVMKFGIISTLCILKANAVMKNGTFKTSGAILALKFQNLAAPLSQYDHEVFRLFICDFTCKTIISNFLLIRLIYFS